MNSWKIFLMAVVSGLVIFVSVLVSKLLIINAKGGILFFSLQPKYLWNVNEENLEDYQESLEHRLKVIPKVAVVIYPNFKITEEGGGLDDNSPIVYAGWQKWNGWSILKIYIDKNEWAKQEESSRNTMLGFFIVNEINSHLGLKGDIFQISHLLLEI